MFAGRRGNLGNVVVYKFRYKYTFLNLLGDIFKGRSIFISSSRQCSDAVVVD